jgi:hypothetical protein
VTIRHGHEPAIVGDLAWALHDIRRRQGHPHQIVS